MSGNDDPSRESVIKGSLPAIYGSTSRSERHNTWKYEAKYRRIKNMEYANQYFFFTL